MQLMCIIYRDIEVKSFQFIPRLYLYFIVPKTKKKFVITHRLYMHLIVLLISYNFHYIILTNVDYFLFIE